ncbi:MAG: SUMF1/EgtB/PvdO family nonheme iron enzyme [Methylacidiphilales bacterium]|nr:SUMF1/EgtB/PvdO family nonheme iron enzyme [Candidatus Methylacidiphilales bacterium]
MSRAGKFIPGGGGGKAKRTGPIRAPDPESGPPDPNKPAGAKKSFVKGSLVKPVAKGQRPWIAIMSAFVCCFLVSAGWYTLAYLPAQRQLAEYKQRLADQEAADAKARADAEAAHQAELAQQAAERGVLTVDSNPTGATVTIGDFRKTTPANFTGIIPGTFSMSIHLDGYEDYKQDVTVTADKPTDLGTITLVQKSGNLSLTSPQSGVTYKLTGPNNYSQEGQVPDKLEKLPIGDYLVTATQQDWTLAPIPIAIHDHENVQKEIKFPYAKVSITSVPPGATVRDGRTILGQTPLTLGQLRPRDLNLSVDLPPYALQRVEIHVPDFGNVTKQITLQQDKDFIAACGMPMVWIADGGYWVGKYLVRQHDFDTVAGYNPSAFRGPNLPVETVSWESAMAFCEKLNDYERKAGKLPSGYHYTLPRESQWETFSADANIDLAATSRVNTLSSTQDAGYSEPNKYGLYDTIGNVWEWCLDDYDDKGDHSLRGGSWLSSAEHFPNAQTRNGGAPKYVDQFTGFRVVLVPN